MRAVAPAAVVTGRAQSGTILEIARARFKELENVVGAQDERVFLRRLIERLEKNDG